MILPLSYAMALFLAQIAAAPIEFSSTQNRSNSSQETTSKTPSEAYFIVFEYGVWLEPKKVSRRERLALALTKSTQPDQ
jgi:hypothetical protein